MPDMPCDLCETTRAVVLSTLIDTGDTLALCPYCIPLWAETVTAGIDATPSGDVTVNGDGTVKPAPGNPITDSDPDPAAPKSRRRKAAPVNPAGATMAETAEATHE